MFVAVQCPYFLLMYECWQQKVAHGMPKHRTRGYQEYSFPRLFVPWNIRSHDGTFVLRTIRSLEHSFPGTFIPGTWTFPAADRSCICQPSSTWPTTATVHSRYTQTVDRRYECHQSVKAVADVYNIKPHQIASSSFAFKNLFWSYFTTMMEC